MKSNLKLLALFSAIFLMFAETSFAQRGNRGIDRGMDRGRNGDGFHSDIQAQRKARQLLFAAQDLKYVVNMYGHPRARPAQRARMITQRMVNKSRRLNRVIRRRGSMAPRAKMILQNIRYDLQDLRAAIQGFPLIRKVRPELRHVRMKIRAVNMELNNGWNNRRGRRDY